MARFEVAYLLVALEAARRLDDMSDEAFEHARLVYNVTRADYAMLQPIYARDRRLGKVFETPTAKEVVNLACSDLLTLLGLEVTGRLDRVLPLRR